MTLQLLTHAEILALPLDMLMAQAAALRDREYGSIHTYSRKVFIPLTHLCRDVCAYCTFARPPKSGEAVFLSREEVLAIARAGAAAGCTEALFTLGERPELRYRAAREALAELGHATTIGYLAEMCRAVLDETGLLPHANPGTLSAEELALLRHVSVSQGMMLESISERLCEPGGPHYGSPDKHPTARLQTLERAGAQKIPFTTGILIGIGETREDRLEALHAINESHLRHGHIQEVIIQNFRAKEDTRMNAAPEPDFDDLLWTIASARLICSADISIQAPPNLSEQNYPRLIEAGINDWGGISPVTIDHVNPEAPWPHIASLAEETAAQGKILVQRLPLYPQYLAARSLWLDEKLIAPTLRVPIPKASPAANPGAPAARRRRPRPPMFRKSKPMPG
jgi:FO synthase